MKNFKNIFTILIVCAISTAHAKRTGAQAPVTQPTQPVYTPQPQIQPQPKLQVQPSAQTQTIQQLVNYVKTAKSNDVWDNANTLLKNSFVADVIQKTKSAGLNDDYLDILLTIARDCHAQFTGNNAQDIGILTKLEQQRETAINTFNKIAF